MAPSMKATRSQVGRKQSKISTFGRITKASPAAISQKSYLPNVAPAVRFNEATDSCLVTRKKRRYDATDGEEHYDHEGQVEAPVLKKV
jgi:hypothetical protein